ncbi:DUF1491 family protein [Labrenzia sp. DG1229]|uniref:DUF1491 family protein n=1 Tax=Labrenzia sp. DG1229 TaxID=681847 RepID=UPI00048A604B|nr:DUF1491 family protein [Labrenzia sp. DG1229]
MRVTSEFFVSALVRRTFGEGGFAAISRRGAEEAGAVFVCVDRLDGTYDLYGPAPQAMFQEQPLGRLFESVLAQCEKSAIDIRLQKEARMDPDYWLVEIEARNGDIDLPIAREEDEKKNVSGSDIFRI